MSSDTTNDVWDQQEFDQRFAEAMRVANTGDLVAARNLYRELLRSEPQGYLNYGSTLLNLGQAEFCTGNLAEGRRLIEESNRVFPGCILTYQWLAPIYWKEKRYYMFPVVVFRYLRNIPAINAELIRLQNRVQPD